MRIGISRSMNALFAFGACALMTFANSAGAARPEKPNFVIILADDMGYGDSSAYGGWIKTPNLERLAEQGLRFTDFHASGNVCSPTRAGFMTGRYQQRAGVAAVLKADDASETYAGGLKTTEIVFPKLLRQAGYTSALIGKWHLGYSTEYNPIHHGFDRFRGYVSGNIDYISHYDRMERPDWWDGLELKAEEGYLTHLIQRHAIDFIRENKERPFCLYVAHEAVHSPMQGPGDPPVRGPHKGAPVKGAENVKRAYREMMEEMDLSIGAIADELQSLGIAGKTLVFFFSDNGATAQGSNAPLRGNKGSNWEGGHREPAIAWQPGAIEAGRTTDQLCISLDLMPTMLELAGAAAPEGHRFDGISLAPLLYDAKSLGERQLFWNGKAMRDGPWKLIIEGKGQSGIGLYNLDEDIGEQIDLAESHPERVKKMLAAIESWKADVGLDN